MGHLVFAGLGMLLLARRAIGLPRFPALVAAVSYMATPRLISHLGAGHVTILQTVAWFPWLALACWATVREPRRWGALLGICLRLTIALKGDGSSEAIHCGFRGIILASRLPRLMCHPAMIE